MKTILLTKPLDEDALRRLRQLPDVTVEIAYAARGKYELPAEQARRAHLLLCRTPPTNFDELTALEFMQIASAGYDHLAPLKLAERSVRVCNARGIFETAIAEWNLAMMINLTRDLRGMIRNQDRAHWEKAERFQHEVRGQTVGIWGYGGIGRDTARVAKAFGMRVDVMTRAGVKPRHDVYQIPGTGDPDGVLPDRVFTAGQELDFLRGVNHLVLALPLTRSSDGMIGERELRALPRSAFVLNPARGRIIQEQALLQALREGWIAGAALDTHYAYPLPPEHPLWSFPNVILTPHISGADHSQYYLGRISDLCVQNVERFLASRPLLNEVTKEEWRAT